MKGAAAPAALFALAAALVLCATRPANRSEAEDAYFYSLQVEAGDGSEFYHAHHPLYLPAGRLLYRGAQGLGYRGRALELLSAWSLVSGAVCAGALFALLRRAGAPGGPWALGLLGSYGFWRYAVEAEIYVPMMAPALLALLPALSNRRGAAWLSGVLLTAAMLLHLAAAAALGGAAAALWSRGRRRAAAGLAAGVLLAVAAAMGAAHRHRGLVLYPDPGVARPALLRPGTLALALGVAGHSTLSGNFLFALPSAAGRIEAAFPHRFLAEELWMGRKAPRGTGPIAVFTLAAALAAGLRVAAGRWKDRRPPGGEAAGPEARALRAAAAVWLGLTVLAALRTEPDNVEMWLMALPSAWLLAGLAGRPARGRALAAAWLFAACVLAHNWFGGMRMLRDPRGDYLARKADLVAGRAGPNDWILTADSHVFATYLAYRTGAEVLDAKFLGVPELRARLESDPPERLFVFGEVLSPLPPLLRRRPPEGERLAELGDRLRPQLLFEEDSELGSLYRAKPGLRLD